MSQPEWTVQKCRACDKAIVFLRSATPNKKTGKRGLVPVNAETVQHDDYTYDSTRHVSHFSDCPEAKRFRTRA